VDRAALDVAIAQEVVHGYRLEGKLPSYRDFTGGLPPAGLMEGARVRDVVQ